MQFGLNGGRAENTRLSPQQVNIHCEAMEKF